MEKIVFLGPKKTTFSYEAYERYSKNHKIPKLNSRNSELISVTSNSDIIKTMKNEPGSYGVLAVETKAGGRVTESVEQFIDLLNEQSISILAAIEMRINFVLMVKPGVTKKMIKGIFSHEKTFGACRKKINSLSTNLIEVSGNGRAAEMIATNIEYSYYAAIGSISAAKKFGLEILDFNIEDEEAWTTFFILGPSTNKIKTQDKNRSLIVFKIKDEKGGLVRAINTLKRINLIHIHSASLGGREYGFVIEIEVSKKEIPLFKKTIHKFKKCVAQSTIFGPFGIKKRL